MVDMIQSPGYRVELVRLAQNKLDPGAQDLFTSIFSKDKIASNAKSGNTELMSTGQIESMQVPDGWVKRDNVQLRAGAGLTEYHPAGNNDVRLNSYYRGMRISSDAAKAFKDCLNKGPHDIAKGSAELNSLSAVLDDKARNFNVTKAFTDLRGGKKVLVVDGSYKDAEHTTSKTVYVDSDGTGSAIQEISYTAPGALYKAHLPEAEKALKSIIWK